MSITERDPQLLRAIAYERTAMHDPANVASQIRALELKELLYRAGFLTEEQIALELNAHMGFYDAHAPDGPALELAFLGGDVDAVLFNVACTVEDLGRDLALRNPRVFAVMKMVRTGPTLSMSESRH